MRSSTTGAAGRATPPAARGQGRSRKARLLRVALVVATVAALCTGVRSDPVAAFPTDGDSWTASSASPPCTFSSSVSAAGDVGTATAGVTCSYTSMSIAVEIHGPPGLNPSECSTSPAAGSSASVTCTFPIEGYGVQEYSITSEWTVDRMASGGTIHPASGYPPECGPSGSSYFFCSKRLSTIVTTLPAAGAQEQELATDPTAWIPVEGDMVFGVDESSAASSGSGVSAASHADPGQGFTVLGATPATAGSDSRLVIRLVTSPGVESLRSPLQSAINPLLVTTGVDVSIAPGTVSVPDRANLQPRRGEILLVVHDRSPCDAAGSNWAGCGGPRQINESALSGTPYISGGAVWIRPYAVDYGLDDLTHLLRHEVGHTFGLGHFDGTWNGEIQVMHPSSYDAVNYRGGDNNGLRFFAENGTRDFVGWGPYSGGLSGARASINQTYRPVAGDFDGDLRDDLFLHAPGTATDRILWGQLFQTEFGAAGTSTTYSVSGTYVPIAGDFDGDGHDDLFFYAPGTASDTVWWGQGSRSSFGPTGQTSVTVSGTYTPVVGDFDGDGRDDVFFYAPGTGTDWLWWGQPSRSDFGTSGTSNSFTVSGTYRPVAADFDGDTIDDLLWYAPGTATDRLWWGTGGRSSFGSTVSFPTINGSYTPVGGDFDGDLFGDIVWYGSGPSADVVWHGDPTRTFVGEGVTIGGDFTLVPGDYDGNLATDVVGYRPGL